MLEMGLAGCRSMTTREDVAESAERWQAHCRKTDTPSETALCQLQANTPGEFSHWTRSYQSPQLQTDHPDVCLVCLVTPLEYGLKLHWGTETALCQGINSV